MKKNMMRLFAVIALVAMWTACNEQESYMQGPDEAMAQTLPASTLSAPTSFNGIVPVILDNPGSGGNVSCELLGIFEYSTGKVDYELPKDQGGGVDPDFEDKFPGFTIMVTGGTYVEWSFTPPAGMCLVDLAVIVKGSNDANIYYYPDDTYYSDEDLAAPLNASGSPAGLSNLTFCYNLVECEEPPVCDWIGETAWAAGTRYTTRGNWATFSNVAALKDGVKLYAGQTMEAGTVKWVAGEIVITLNEGWRFEDVEENVKIQGYNTPPSGNPAPGLFETKGYADPDNNTFTIPVKPSSCTTCARYQFYGVHVNVEWEKCE